MVVVREIEIGIRVIILNQTTFVKALSKSINMPTNECESLQEM